MRGLANKIPEQFPDNRFTERDARKMRLSSWRPLGGLFFGSSDGRVRRGKLLRGLRLRRRIFLGMGPVSNGFHENGPW